MATPAFILARTVADLQLYAATTKGSVEVAKDPWNVVELLRTRPPSWLAILLYEADGVVKQANSATPVLQCTLGVYMAANLGLNIAPGTPLYTDEADRDALLTVMAGVRERICSLDLDADLDNPGQSLAGIGDRWEYSGMRPESVDGIPLWSFRMEFRTLYSVDAFTLRTPAE